MNYTKRLYFKEIADSIEDPLVTTFKGLYTDKYKTLLNKSTSIENYLELLSRHYPDLNTEDMLLEIIDLKDSSIYEELLDIYNEYKEKSIKENYNLKTSKEVQKAYKQSIKNVDSSDNWNDISNGAEKEREYYFKLHPELSKDEKKENLSDVLHKKLTVSIKEAKYIESIIKNYMKKRNN